MRRRDLALASAAATTAGFLLDARPRAPSARASPSVVPDASPASSTAVPDYTLRGPYRVRRLPKLEHTCVSCFPRCVGDACLLSIDAYVPSAPPPLPDAMFPRVTVPNEREASASPADAYSRGPYPLAVITSGFLVDAEQYASYARRLCSWGYVVLQYNKRENVAGGNALDDVVSAAMVRELIGWARSDVLLGPLLMRDDDDCPDDDCPDEMAARGGARAYRGGVYLIGHSRGGKISMLEGVDDERVRCACLLDPVDNTAYAPLGDGFPSAVAAMRAAPEDAGPSLCVVGGKYGGDCAPLGSNYATFLDASRRGDTWGVEVRAGHFQFLDSAGLLQRAVCLEGSAADAQVREVAQALMVAHAETAFRGVPRGRALKQTLATLEQMWGGGAFGAATNVAGGELPWIVLRDGGGGARTRTRTRTRRWRGTRTRTRTRRRRWTRRDDEAASPRIEARRAVGVVRRHERRA